MLHEKYLNSSDGEEYVRRKLKCISTSIRPKPFLRLLVTVVLNFSYPYNSYVRKCWKNMASMFSPSTFPCPVNLLEFCKSSSSNCTANSTVNSEEYLISFDKFMPPFEIS